MKKVLCILLVVLLIFALAAAAGFGVAWYQNNHIFVEDAVYPIDSQELDLRGQDISFDHYNSVHSQLPACEILWDVPFQGGKYSNDSESLTVTTLTEADAELLLEYFPNLKKLDATGVHDYELLESLQSKLPACEIIYEVSVGGKTFAPDTTELVLENGDYDLDTLKENLPHLPDVTNITLKKPELSLEELEALKAEFEAIEFYCTVEIGGVEYDMETTELDLSDLTSSDVDAVCDKLAMLPGLTNVELMDAAGNSQLTKEDVKKLMDAAPDAVFNYTFDFFGITLSTSDTEVHIKNKTIGDKNVDEIRLALDLLTNCDRFVMEYCGMSDEVMAELRDEYRGQTKVVWRVNYGGGGSLTDVEVIRCTFDLSNSNCKALKYCEDVRFMDLGHNDVYTLMDCSYIAYMPNLECVILSSASVSDLSAFENCKKLKFLELTFCGLVTDISPLKNCESLTMLNISYTGVTDLSPLDDLDMELLCAKNYSYNRVSEEDQARFAELHPDCWAQYVGEQPYGPGWRYTEDGKDFLPYYKLMRMVFKLDEHIIPNNVGWYISDVPGVEITENGVAMVAETAAEEA